jgi:pimeloyl-ACP methyl ester carboxylesterase
MATTPSARSTNDWRSVDWPSHQRWVQARGRPVNVVELGDGDQPVVFVHGLSGCWQNWLPNLPVFAERHRVFALDLPGFGESPLPAEEISIRGYAEILDALLGELGIDAAAVVGNSMGGFIGAELALAAPQRVERLVLVGAAGLSIQDEWSDRQLVALRRAEALLAMQGAWVASRSEAFARRPGLRKLLMSLVVADTTRVPADLAREQLRGSGKPGFMDALAAMARYPIADRLDDVGCPTLIVHGDRDKLVPVRDADEFERLIPESRKIVYEGIGHVPQLEVPDRFNADVAAFLAD